MNLTKFFALSPSDILYFCQQIFFLHKGPLPFMRQHHDGPIPGRRAAKILFETWTEPAPEQPVDGTAYMPSSAAPADGVHLQSTGPPPRPDKSTGHRRLRYAPPSFPFHLPEN